jgi:hypothetical protein
VPGDDVRPASFPPSLTFDRIQDSFGKFSLIKYSDGAYKAYAIDFEREAVL